ncbi:MAG: PQQ-like beta-propeller repeat protein [Acidobacteria bacterium]|nr:PQQ-like beta-propeller repeat protein [Acidobacteriota bacterium]
MKTQHRIRFAGLAWAGILTITAISALTLSAHEMDRRSIAIGPDGTTYTITQTMNMMGGGPNDQGMQLELVAVGQDNRVKWSYRIPGGEPTSPVAGSDGTVYFALTPMGGDGDRQHGPEFGPAKLYAVKDGNLKWTFQIDRGMPSAPAAGPGGNIYLTTNCFAMIQGTHDSNDMDGCEQSEQAGLLAIEDRQTSAVLRWSRNLDAMMLSEPVVQVKGPTDWTISVTGLSATQGGMGGGMMGEPVLFRFRPDGSFQTIRLARGGHM